MEKILIVEDEVLIANDVREALQGYGYEVAGVLISGEAAVEFVKKDKPDLILMDIMLEGKMNGIEAAMLIAEENTIPVIYLTAFSDVRTLRKASESNPYGYILKPFDERDLLSIIDKTLHKLKKNK